MLRNFQIVLVTQKGFNLNFSREFFFRKVTVAQRNANVIWRNIDFQGQFKDAHIFTQKVESSREAREKILKMRSPALLGLPGAYI